MHTSEGERIPGQVFYSSGRLKYDGEFKDGVLDGTGTKYYNEEWIDRNTGNPIPYKKAIEGNWLNGEMHGKCTGYNSYGNKTYECDFKQGMAYHGTVYYKQSSHNRNESPKKMFKGDLYNLSYLHGKGIRYRDDEYNTKEIEGDFEMGRAHGEATFFIDGIKRYVGNYSYGRREGYGTWYHDDGEHLLYAGEWFDDKRYGRGKAFWDGATNVMQHVAYDGEWAKDWRAGTGTSYFYNPEEPLKPQKAYHGQWLFDREDGVGTWYRKDGTKQYYGPIFANAMDSRAMKGYAREDSFKIGTLYYEGGVKVHKKGTFQNGVLHGEGEERELSGTLIYKGKYDDGLFHGDGILYFPNSEWPKYTGQFKYGQFEGKGTLYKADGTVDHHGSFFRGIKMVKSQHDDVTTVNLATNAKVHRLQNEAAPYSQVQKLFDKTSKWSGYNKYTEGKEYDDLRVLDVYQITYTNDQIRKDYMTAVDQVAQIKRDAPKTLDYVRECGGEYVRSQELQLYDAKGVVQPLNANANEVLLFHGTPSKYLQSIVENGGFNKEQTKLNSFGVGWYFADDPWKSENYSDRPGTSAPSPRETPEFVETLGGFEPDQELSVGYMLICRVALGCAAHVSLDSYDRRSTVSKLPLFEDSDKQSNLAWPFNSLIYDANPKTDKQHRSWKYREFVVFEESHALPVYIVAFQRVKRKTIAQRTFEFMQSVMEGFSQTPPVVDLS